MANLIVSLVILSILSLSIAVIINEKRKGVKCIGCPYGGTNKAQNCGSDVINFD
jgi:hypothetical protein